MPTMEKEFDDDGDERCDSFGPERRAVDIRSSTAAALGVHCQPRAFLIGFKDCHQEVLRYLVNIEQVPLEGPVIFGLEKHLTNLESRMQTTSRDCADGSCETLTQSNGSTQLRGNKTDDDDDEEKEDDEFSSFKNCLTTAQDERFLEEKEPVCDTSSGGLINGHRTAAAVRAENSSFDSGCCDFSGILVASSSEDSSVIMDCSYDEASTTAPCSDAAEFPKQHSGSGAGNAKDDSDTVITESELAENALELMRLAHNNPCISRILNELFVLMENDYDDDDVDDDNDDDNEDDHNDDGIDLMI